MKQTKTKTILYTALSCAFVCLCSQIYIPGAIPVTMQTFASVLLGYIFGIRIATLSVVLYILLGALGLPVFSGLSGGFGTLFGARGGYITGCIFVSLFSGLAAKYRNKPLISFLITFSGLCLCYLWGTVWYSINFASSESFFSLLSICVLPFIVPDTVKILIAHTIAKRLYFPFK